jgi:hypothetical protein
LGGKSAAAKSVIQIFLPGGMSAQESFDPKMYAPVEYRGPLEAVKTKLDGVHFSQSLKETADVADRITVRALDDPRRGGARTRRAQYVHWLSPQSGRSISEFRQRCLAATGARENLPPYVCIPNQPNIYAGTGYLGSAYGPFSLGSDPGNGNFAVRDLSLPTGVDDQRFADRAKCARWWTLISVRSKNPTRWTAWIHSTIAPTALSVRKSSRCVCHQG